MHIVFDWIARYGYAGLFGLLVLGIVGLPVPDETLLTFAGYLVYRGQLQLGPTLAAGFMGSACGITISYLIGQTTGYWLVARFGAKIHLTEDRIQRVHNWFERLGRWTLTFGYFIPGVRHITALVAGASKLEYSVFALFAYAGAVLWSCGFVLLGYFVGEEWTRIGARMHRIVLIAAGIAAALAILAFLWRRCRTPRI